MKASTFRHWLVSASYGASKPPVGRVVMILKIGKGKINREHNLKSSFLLMENKAKARDVYNVLNDRHFDNLEDVKIIISDGGISLSIRMINFFH